MAAIEDRYRSYVVDGDPVVTGVVAVGDSWSCTNPSLGRGTSIGILHAKALRDVLREIDTADHEQLVRRFDELTRNEIEPWYRRTLAFDRHRLAEIEADIAGTRTRPTIPSGRSPRRGQWRATLTARCTWSVCAAPGVAFGTGGGVGSTRPAGPDHRRAGGAAAVPRPGPDRAALLKATRKRSG